MYTIYCLMFFHSFAMFHDEVGCPTHEELDLLPQDSLVLYNVITPNGDGQNDVLFFDFLDEFSQKEILVIDQWGSTVYENLNYDNQWGGDRNGDPLPAGNYRYYLRLDAKTYSSNLTIIYN